MSLRLIFCRSVPPEFLRSFFDFSPLCIFKCLQNRLLERLQSHIGCICLIFLRYVLSNVSSNCLPKKTHSLIGCIYSFFSHYVFSNVSLKHLHERMHSHIGCIYLIFLHCVFSNVSSKHMSMRKQSHTGCKYLTFLHYVWAFCLSVFHCLFLWLEALHWPCFYLNHVVQDFDPLSA